MGINKNKQLGMLLAVIAMAMLGFSYALVPIYNIICGKFAVTGRLGEPAAGLNTGPVDKARWVNMEFISTDYTGGPLVFHTMTPSIKVHPGENKIVNFLFTNNSDHTIVMRTMPSITPGIAAKYFKRIECFCFHLQSLKSKESVKMSLFFYMDPHLPRNIGNVTVSYALYNAKQNGAKN
jgi:cytochrome c oxidase assembly protein subunit 11